MKSDLVFLSRASTKIARHTLRRAFHTALDTSGIQDFHFHDIRHTFATRLAQGGVDTDKIIKLPGHTCIPMSTRGAHHCPESWRDGVNILENSSHDLITIEGDQICQLPESLDLYGGR